MAAVIRARRATNAVAILKSVRAARCIVAACACVVFASVAGAEIVVTDDTGARIVLKTPARRVVSLAPHATEILFAAGAGSTVVGVIKGSDHPAAARTLPVVGDAFALDIEGILLLTPDLVVTWPFTSPAQVALLRERGIAVYTTYAHTVDEIAADIERIGILTGTKRTAGELAASIRARARVLRDEARGRERVRVFYQIADDPPYTINGEHPISRAIELCGGENVFASQRIAAPQVTTEEVLAAHPDMIVAGTDGAKRPAWLDRWARFSDLPAARLGNLFVVDANLLHRPGPRFIDGVAQLCAALDRARPGRAVL
jgi:iron complex transport system substrate-binding protein